jgi:methylated-DNA-[protein]-cysteine S-methyltransferase
MSSPIGLLFIARTERGLRYLEFMDRKSIKRMIARHAAELPDATWEPSLLELKPVVDQLEAYFCGAMTRFEVPLDVVGSDFQRLVWKELLQIPYAETRTYGEIAKAIGQPRSARAVGLANNQNPIAVVVPCHRVIGANGSLTGYGGGLTRKKWLLQHEARFAKLGSDQVDLFTAVAGRSGGRKEPR